MKTALLCLTLLLVSIPLVADDQLDLGDVTERPRDDPDARRQALVGLPVFAAG